MPASPASAPAPSPSSSSSRDSHRHRRRTARLFLAVILVGLYVAEALLWYFTNNRSNPWPFLVGHVVGSALATTLLIIGIWRRNSWARYVLIVFLWYLIAIFGIVVLVVAGEEYKTDRKPLMAAIVAVGIYVAANTLLICSRRIQYLAQPAGSGG